VVPVSALILNCIAGIVNERYRHVWRRGRCLESRAVSQTNRLNASHQTCWYLLPTYTEILSPQKHYVTPRLLSALLSCNKKSSRLIYVPYLRIRFCSFDFVSGVPGNRSRVILGQTKIPQTGSEGSADIKKRSFFLENPTSTHCHAAELCPFLKDFALVQRK
jgi:hypothetical protein